MHFFLVQVYTAASVGRVWQQRKRWRPNLLHTNWGARKKGEEGGVGVGGGRSSQWVVELGETKEEEEEEEEEKAPP